MSEQVNITIGDTVKLKSGGPLMTVTAPGSGVVTCSYFDDAGTLQKVAFPLIALKKVAS